MLVIFPLDDSVITIVIYSSDNEEDTHYAHCSWREWLMSDFVWNGGESITQELWQTESSWSITGSDS